MNWSTFAGYERPDRLRTFSNLYALVPLGERADLAAGFDYGREARADGQGDGSWSSPLLVARLRLDERNSFAARIERYADPHGVIVSTGGAAGFVAVGASVNHDRQLREGVLWRVELRQVKASDPVFTASDCNPTRDNLFVTTSLSVRF